MHPSLLTHPRLSIVPDRDPRTKKVLVGNLESSSSAKEIIALEHGYCSCHLGALVIWCRLHRAIRVNTDEKTGKRPSILQTKQFSTPKIQSQSALKICRVLIICQVWKAGRYLIYHVSTERRIIQSMYFGVWELVESTAFGLATELAGGTRAEKSVPGFPAGCSPLFIPSVNKGIQ